MNVRRKKGSGGDSNLKKPALLNRFSVAFWLKSQKGPGAWFDPRGISSSYVYFVPILAGFHKRVTDPLGSTIESAVVRPCVFVAIIFASDHSSDVTGRDEDAGAVMQSQRWIGRDNRQRNASPLIVYD